MIKAFFNKSHLVFILLLTGSILGCINNAGESKIKNSGKIHVTDFRGQDIYFDENPKRIICLIESALTGIYMLNAESRIVGVPSSVYDESVAAQYAQLDERIKNKTIIAPGNWDFVNIENIVALNPDLVIMWSSQQESIQAIESRGIPVYGVMLKSTNDVYKEISDLGILTGTEQLADSLIKYTKNELAKVSDIYKENSSEKKKVYFMWPQGPLETSGKNSTVNELITMAGAENVCTSHDEHLVVNLEKVIEWNPDIIVMWYNANKNPEDILSLPGWRNIKAVKDRQVFEMPSVFSCDLWTLKFQFAVKLLSKWAYPEAFESFNIDMDRRQMYSNLYGERGEIIK